MSKQERLIPPSLPEHEDIIRVDLEGERAPDVTPEDFEGLRTNLQRDLQHERVLYTETPKKKKRKPELSRPGINYKKIIGESIDGVLEQIIISLRSGE